MECSKEGDELRLHCLGEGCPLGSIIITRASVWYWIDDGTHYNVDTILGFASFQVVISVTCTGVLIRGNACPTRRVRPRIWLEQSTKLFILFLQSCVVLFELPYLEEGRR